MDRAIAELAIPAASLVTALIAVSFWRWLPLRSHHHQPQCEDDQPGRSVDHGVLVLAGAQLLGVQLESGELVIDVFGGSGTWTGFGQGEALEEGNVAGTPMLTFRASFAHTIDLIALERLQLWAAGTSLVELVVEVAGDSPLHTPTRITIRDGEQALALQTASA
jgi:hypothetical protein